MFVVFHSATKYILTFIFSLIVLAINWQTYSLPIIHINTKDKQFIKSKTVYIPGTYYIVDTHNSDMNVGSEEKPKNRECIVN